MAIEDPGATQSGPYYEQSTLNKFDVMRRDRLPALSNIGLEVREWIESPFSALRFSLQETIRYVLICAIGIPCLQFVWGLHGAWLEPGEFLGVCVLMSLICGTMQLLSDSGLLLIGKAVSYPLVLFLVGRLAQMAESEGSARQGAQVIAVLLACFLVDRICTHYLYWLTADPGLLPAERKTMRGRWKWRMLSLHSVGLALFAWLLFGVGAGNLSWLFAMGAGATVAGIAIFRPFPIARGKTGLMVVPLATISWIGWGRHEDLFGTKTPGLFQSLGGSKFERWALSILTVAALSATISPGLTGALSGFTEVPMLHAVLRMALGLMFVPLMIMIGIGLTSARRLALLNDDLEDFARLSSSSLAWRRTTEAIRTSPDPLTKSHLFLGTHYHSMYPVLLYLNLLLEHMHILGASGSGKTSRGLLPLLTQIIERNDSAVIVLDFKGDGLLFQGLRAASGARFKHFTNIVGKSSHVFNPFAQLSKGTMSINQFCEIVLEALRLNHGEGYGRSYFSRLARLWLSDILHQNPNLTSFHDLFAILKKQPPPGPAGDDERMVRKECFELISVIHSLSMVESLNWENVPGASQTPIDAQIFMPDVLEKRQVVYFNLPDSHESYTVKEIGNLALFAAFEAARAASARGLKVYLVIDEFQNIASRQFERILREARGFNMSVILSHQALGDLETPDAPELAAVVQQNTQIKQYFSATEPALQQFLLDSAGQVRGIQHSYSRTGTLDKTYIRRWFRYRYADGSRIKYTSTEVKEAPGVEETISGVEILVPRLNLNDILNYSSDPEASIVLFGRDSGYTVFGGHWFAIRSPYSLSLAEKEQLEALPWPASTPETIVNSLTSRLHTPFLASKSHQSPNQIAQARGGRKAPALNRPQQATAQRTVQSPAPAQAGPATNPQTQPPKAAHPKRAAWLTRLKQAHAAQTGGKP